MLSEKQGHLVVQILEVLKLINDNLGENNGSGSNNNNNSG